MESCLLFGIVSIIIIIIIIEIELFNLMSKL